MSSLSPADAMPQSPDATARSARHVPAPASMTPREGRPQRFGRYELLSLIGRGGMAEVWRARLEQPAGGEKILVVKRILPSYSADPEQLRLFVNEAKIALPLTHGNITSVFEFGEVDGEYFLAMEFIHGQNLDAVLHRCRQTLAPMPIPAALFVAGEIAKGLAYAHGFTSPAGARVEVVHLDVSPQNVLVSYDGAVKLTDFGIAKVKHSGEARVDVLRGKPAYLAPEQLDDQDRPLQPPRAVDGRTDVFALGSVLYTMLTGVPPFQGRTDEETLEMVAAGAVALPSAVRAGLEPYDALVMRALAVDPAHRYQRASDFAVALNQAMVERFPGYGSHELASWLRELFAWDIFEAQASGENALKDRLLFQLTHAKVEFDPSRSTKELLSVGTVSIPPPSPPPPPMADPDAARRRLRAGVALVTLLVGTGALVIGLGVHFFGTEVQGLGTAPTRDAPSVDGTHGTGGPTGTLSLNAWPSAIVYLNGEKLPDRTPLLNLTVPAGKHKLRFERPDLGLKKELEVEVPAGGARTVAVKLDR